MSCPKCNTPLPAFASKFCPKCGAKIGDSSAPSTPTKATSTTTTTATTTTTTTTTHASAPPPSTAHATTTHTTSSAPSTPTKSAPEPQHQTHESPAKKNATFCQRCQSILIGDMVEDTKGLLYHPACFSCATCSTRITAAYTYDKEGRVTCETCARKQLHLTGEDVCAKCHSHIEGPLLIVANRRYHKECFVCVSCGTSLEGHQLAITDQGLMCKPCNLRAHGLVCCVCGGLIEDEAPIRAMDKNWHEKCFACVQCNKNLAKDGKYFREGDHPYCPDCAVSIHSSSSESKSAAAHPPPHSSTGGGHHESAATSSGEHKSHPKFCSNCGTPAAGKFCSECGTAL